MNYELPTFLRSNEIHLNNTHVKKKHSLSFIDRTLKSIANVIKVVYIQGDTASRNGLLQLLDARVKSIFLFFFIMIISLDRQVSSQLFIAVFFFVLLLSSAVNLGFVYKKVIGLSAFFGFLVIAPAALNIVTNGEIIFKLAEMIERGIL